MAIGKINVTSKLIVWYDLFKKTKIKTGMEISEHEPKFAEG